MIAQLILLALALWVIWYYLLPATPAKAQPRKRVTRRVTTLLDNERESVDTRYSF